MRRDLVAYLEAGGDDLLPIALAAAERIRGQMAESA
jgi:hypothetical protein